ncbi:MAG TPA: hypothetical protein VG389_21320 [Myxococcota bacterium]|jgi:hypothetical protein|nr:hypothetical protein [Myxococcota bacterium]
MLILSLDRGRRVSRASTWPLRAWPAVRAGAVAAAAALAACALPACRCAGAGSDAATAGDAAGNDAAAAATDAATPPGDAGPPCTTLLVEPVSAASVLAPPGGAVPAAGAPFDVAATGVSVVRVSDAADPGATSSDYTNGYSRWSPASWDGSYVVAFGTDGLSVVYRLSDRTIVRALDVGEPNELQWDRSGAPGGATRLYYRTGAQLRRVDVLSGADALVHDFTADFPGALAVLNGVEGAPSNDMSTWAFQVCAGMDSGGQCLGLMDIVSYDLGADALIARLSDTQPAIPTPNFVDVSPSGARVLVGSCKVDSTTPEPWNGPWAWSPDFSARVRAGTNCDHSGWAWGAAGEEYYVTYDSCGAGNDEVTPTCDYIMAVNVADPAGWDARIGVLYQGDLGWGNSTHFGRVYEPSVAGWAFVSTYTDSETNWGANQLFFLELVPEALGPRVLRVAPSMDAYVDYWSEGFASLDFAAGHVYWGANWNGAAELELYRATLCDAWWEAAAR